tara:strand:+ start:1580 stop:5845 length:4266 start_codon:yes stop_codon:yes gene_type:complete
MAKFLSNINLETANDLQFKTTAGTNAGKISQTGNDLVLSNPVGDILLGDGASDIYVGDGINSIDILFEQSGSIKADDSASGVTLTLGSSNTTLSLVSPTITGTITDNSTNGLATLSGAQTFTGTKTFADSVKLLFGNQSGGDLQIYHDGSNSYIDEAGVGALNIRSNSIVAGKYTGEVLFRGTADGAFEAFHDNSVKLSTTSSGIDVTGEVKGDSLDIDGNADISGNLTLSGTYPRIKLTDSNNNDDYDIINDNGTFIVYNDTDSSTAFAIAGNNNATFSGGVIVNGGAVQVNNAGTDKKMSFDRTGGKGISIEHDASSIYFYNETDSAPIFKMFNAGDVRAYGEVEATSLDVNGNADISGNITGATWNGGVISSAYLDTDTAHLSGSQTFTGAKVMQGNLTLDDGAGDTPTLRFINGDDDVYQFFQDGSSDMKLTRTNNGGVDYNFNAHETDYTQSVLQIGGTSTFGTDVTIAGNLTVNGTTVTVDTTNLNVQDKNITLNYSTSDSSSSANGAGITIQDAVNSSTDATILWDTSASQFKISHPINILGNILTSGTVDGRDLQTDGTKLDTIDTNANAYVHPTNAGNKHIPAAGATGQVLQYAGSAGTAQWHTLTSSDVGLGNVANVDQRNASNINNGTIGASFLPTTISSNTSGSAASLSGLSLGDIVYGGESGYAKLSGNAESNNKFLRSRGAANTATEPEWTQVGYSDLTGTVPTWNQNTTGSAATLSSTLAVNRGGTGAASLDAAGIVEKSGAQTIGGTKTFTGSLLLDDGTGASPTMRFMNSDNDEVSIFCNTSGKMKFQQKLDGAGSPTVQMTMDENGLDVVNGLKINGSAVHATDTSTSLGTSNTLVPSQNAVKSYVDNEVAGAGGGTMSNFLLAATGTGNTATIGQGDTVTFGAGTGITATRSGNQINIANSAPNVVQTTITGNAGTATKLQTARNIAGVSFDGSGDISLNNNNITNGAGYTTNTGTTTASNTQTFTNKTIDANGTGNSITNIDIGNMTAAVIVTESEGIGNNDNDTTIPTSAAVVDYVANNAGGGQTYSVSVPNNTTKLRLTASGGTTDDIEFTGGTDISVTRTNGSALSIAYTGAGGYTLPAATSSALGGIKIGFTTNASNRNYAVQLSSQKAYVNVPWTDNNTTYTAGSLLDLSGTQFNVDLTEATAATIAAGDNIIFIDGGATGTQSKGSINDVATLFAGLGLSATNGVLDVNLGHGLSIDVDTIKPQVHQNLVVSSSGIGVSTDIQTTTQRIGRAGTNGLTLDFSATDNCVFETNASTPVTVLQIGTNGNASLTGTFLASNVTSNSDERIKKDIEDIPSYKALEVIKEVKGVRYNWKEKHEDGEFTEYHKDKPKNGLKEIGFIAQDLEKILPELVDEVNDDNDFKSVNYAKMVVVLTEAMKEQQKQIEKLQKQINKLL